LSQNGVGSTEIDCVVKFSSLNPNIRRVWPFGGLFCLRFFREDCSPSRRAAAGLLYQTTSSLAISSAEIIISQQICSTEVSKI